MEASKRQCCSGVHCSRRIDIARAERRRSTSSSSSSVTMAPPPPSSELPPPPPTNAATSSSAMAVPYFCRKHVALATYERPPFPLYLFKTRGTSRTTAPPAAAVTTTALSPCRRRRRRPRLGLRVRRRRRWTRWSASRCSARVPPPYGPSQSRPG